MKKKAPMACGRTNGTHKIETDISLSGRSVLARVALLTFAVCGLSAGCSDGDGGAYQQGLSFTAEESGSSPALDDQTEAEVESDIHELWSKDLRDGPEVRHLGVARLLSEVGVVELLGRYIVNIPNGAFFLANYETQAAVSASRISHIGEGIEGAAMWEFEREMLLTVRDSELFWSPAPVGSDPLHEAFFEVFEQCGRDSPWPEVQMADRQGNAAGDVLYRDPELGISDYEYRELLHVCGRYAATYPSLKPEMRDELLASQRAYFAQLISDRLSDTKWPLEVPLRYQAEVEHLRQNGW